MRTPSQVSQSASIWSRMPSMTAEHRHVREDRGEVELAVLGVLLQHQLRLAVVPVLEALADPRADLG